MLNVSKFRMKYLNGDLTPNEVISDHIRYSSIVSRKTNAISTLNPEAPQLAEESTNRYKRGEPIGALDGIPVIVKDSYHVKNLPRWHGSAIHDGDPVSGFSSEPVRRLEEEGAIVVAKTTMPDMGMLASGISSQFGIVRNPWNLKNSPGGSSSGTGAALACGFSALGLGTDIAGSVRLPAAHCGLAGIKPTQGRIAYSPSSVMRSAGILGRSVSDLVEGLACVGKEAASDIWCLPGSFVPVASENVLSRKPKVGLLLDMGYGVQPEFEVKNAVYSAAERLGQSGCQVKELTLDLSESDFADVDRVFKAHAAAEIRSSRHPTDVLDIVKKWVSEAGRLSMVDYEDAMNRILVTVNKIMNATEEFDFLVCPVVPVVSFSAESPGPGDEYELLHHTQFTAWFNQTCQPSAVYCETMSSSGMPIDVQIVGKKFNDAAVLALCELLEQSRSNTIHFPSFVGAPDYEE